MHSGTPLLSIVNTLNGAVFERLKGIAEKEVEFIYHLKLRCDALENEPGIFRPTTSTQEILTGLA